MYLMRIVNARCLSEIALRLVTYILTFHANLSICLYCMVILVLFYKYLRLCIVDW